MSSFSHPKASVTERRRWQPRHDCRINARLGLDGHETGCRIVNISAGGAGIVFDPVLRPMTGSRIFISSRETGMITCLVRWVSGNTAGLEFDAAGKASTKLNEFLAALAGEDGY